MPKITLAAQSCLFPDESGRLARDAVLQSRAAMLPSKAEFQEHMGAILQLRTTIQDRISG
jgi:hypothetical protein